MSNTNKNIVIGVLLGVLVLMAVAYAAFSTALSINGTATIKSSWNVAFDQTKTTGTGVLDITLGKTGGTQPTGTISYTDGQHAVLGAELYQPGDKVEYTLTVKNTGSLNATLSAATASANSGCTCSNNVCTSTNGHIQFTVGTLSTNSLAASVGQATIKVTAMFLNEDVSALDANESAVIDVSFTATQAAS